MIVTPGSQEILKQAIKLGYVETLMEAGACRHQLDVRRVLRRPHGPPRRRRGVHHRVDAQLPGPHGQPEGEVFMGSPATVAASAVTGVITDPRDL